MIFTEYFIDHVRVSNYWAQICIQSLITNNCRFLSVLLRASFFELLLFFLVLFFVVYMNSVVWDVVYKSNYYLMSFSLVVLMLFSRLGYYNGFWIIIKRAIEIFEWWSFVLVLPVSEFCMHTIWHWENTFTERHKTENYMKIDHWNR